MNATTRQRWWLSAALVVLLLAIGMVGVSCNRTDNDGQQEHQGASQPAVVYTCPMHPQIKESKPGKCSICGMQLVPAK